MTPLRVSEKVIPDRPDTLLPTPLLSMSHQQPILLPATNGGQRMEMQRVAQALVGSEDNKVVVELTIILAGCWHLPIEERVEQIYEDFFGRDPEVDRDEIWNAFEYFNLLADL